MRVSKSVVALLAISMLSVSCGKKNGENSSGKPSSSSSDVSNLTNSSTAHLKSLKSVQDAFAKLKDNTGLKAGDEIIHTGNAFVDFQHQYSNNTNINLGDAIGDNWFGNLFSGVNLSLGYGTSTNVSPTDTARIYKVESAASTVKLVEATGVSNTGEMIYSNPFNYTRNDDLYRDMLNLDNVTYEKVAVTPVKITLHDDSVINGTHIELFKSGWVADRYIVSTNLPVAANPVNVYRQTDGKQGSLIKIGNKGIKKLSGTFHQLQWTASGKFELVGQTF